MPARTYRMNDPLIHLIKQAALALELPESIWVRQTLKKEAQRILVNCAKRETYSDSQYKVNTETDGGAS